MGFQGSLGGAAYSGTLGGGAVQRFDSCMYVPQRTAIRRALVDRLGSTPTGSGRPLLKSAGGYIVKIGVLPRPLKGNSDEELGFLWIALQGAAPSLAVALGGMSDFESIDGNETQTAKLEVAVYSISQNFRSFVDGPLAPDVVAAGDPTADPGVETMMEHVREILSKQDLGLLGAHELWQKSEDEVATGSDVAIWEQRFSVTVETSVNPQRADSDLVTSVEVQHDLDGLDDSQQPLIDFITDLEVP